MIDPYFVVLMLIAAASGFCFGVGYMMSARHRIARKG